MESLNVFDWILVAIIATSSVFGLLRGFVKELLSLASWVAAFFVARLFSFKLSNFMVDWIDQPQFRVIAAFVILFAATLVVGALINNVFSRLVSATGLTGTDRLFGMVFGVVRGGLLVIVMVSLLSLTPVSNDEWWQSSLIIPHFILVDEWSYKMSSSASGLLDMLQPTLL
ncbi:MAG: membrane protein required for colicin V production [Oceanospirillaceae bacterium]|jgi:membrane protein required for colicin V production|tara:strand:+ start:21272 stop:21784 length:513 start_codon:yes stop_codon:yes gene_type:complete